MGCESTVSSLITNLKGLIVPLLPFSYFYSGRSWSFLEAAFPSMSKTPILGTSPELRKTTTIYGDVLPWRFSSRGRWPAGRSPSFAEAALQRLEGSCPGFLGFAEGLRSPCPWLCLPQRTRMCGISHALAWCSKEGHLPQIDSQPVFLENCEEGVIFNLALQYKWYAGWRGRVEGQQAGNWGFIQRGADWNRAGNSLGDSEQGPANLN